MNLKYNIIPWFVMAMAMIMIVFAFSGAAYAGVDVTYLPEFENGRFMSCFHFYPDNFWGWWYKHICLHSFGEQIAPDEVIEYGATLENFVKLAASEGAVAMPFIGHLDVSRAAGRIHIRLRADTYGHPYVGVGDTLEDALDAMMERRRRIQ